MNKITKRSFFSFLALYLVSSFVFLSLAAYWFYHSQVSMEMNNNFYKMNHIADVVSSDVIHAAMEQTPFELKKFPNAKVALLNKNKKVLYGSLIQKPLDFSKDFYMKEGMFTLISKRPVGHLGVEYVVVQSNECLHNIAKIKNKILYVVIITSIFIIIIAVVLSYIFLKPLKDKMLEIETFVKDTTHELNTPITALKMSTSRLRKKQTYDEKIVQNISISTKQLYDIYESLSFISFDTKEEDITLDFAQTVQESLHHFQELADKKHIEIKANINPCTLKIAPTKAKMLISNLLGNAIKYSHPNTDIEIFLDNNTLHVKDKGIGIDPKKLQEIFKRFVRASEYSGGFGVGLSIVEQIIKEYHFRITIDSQPNKGTHITLHF